MSLSSDSRFRTLKQGDHVCAVYDHPDQQTEGMIDYIKTGLALGERCIYIVGERLPEDIYRGLAEAGVDVGAAIDGQRLSLATKRETYLRDGDFNPDRMIDFLRSSEGDALADGCSGLRVSGEMIWALGPEVGRDRIVEYETRLNEFFPGSRSHAICQYNRSRFSPDVIRDVLRTHPIAIVGQSACPNPYYEPPHVILAGSDSAERVDWMLAQLLQLRSHELQLQAAIAERDEFLSVASHELRTPLHALSLALHGLKLNATLDESGRTGVVRAQRQVSRLNRLIGALLDVSRIREGRLEWHFDTTDLMQVAQETAAHFELEARQAGCAIGVSGTPVQGMWDRERVSQILQNLLSNALKFGAGQPVEVTVGTDAETALVTITDHGMGIDVGQQALVFERFGRASSARHYAGMGLGLWIVNTLVQGMHGTVDIDSAPGQGARFTVRLPLVPPHRPSDGHA